MTSRLAFSSSSSTGARISRFVNDVLNVVAEGKRLKAQLDSMSFGSDWTAVETEIGGMQAGTGQTLWSILSTAVSQVDSAQVAELARLDKG